MNDAQFNEIKGLLTAILSKLGGSAPQATSAPVGEVADDAELDSCWGDPEVRKDPARWSGESMVGRRLSECPPEFLDVMASFNDWRADQDDKKQAVDDKGRPKSYYARKDAARCRGWARRIRASQPASPSTHARPTAHTSSAASRQPFKPQVVNDEADYVDDDAGIPF